MDSSLILPSEINVLKSDKLRKLIFSESDL